MRWDAEAWEGQSTEPQTPWPAWPQLAPKAHTGSALAGHSHHQQGKGSQPLMLT